MILYAIRNGVITVKSVKKETTCGWREHNNGFINRRVLGKWVSLDTTYYTTDLEEAKLWVNKTTTHMYDLLQVSKASVSDVEFWEDGGMNENDSPKSRYQDIYCKD